MTSWSLKKKKNYACIKGIYCIKKIVKENGFGSSKVKKLVKWESEELTTLGSLNRSHSQ